MLQSSKTDISLLLLRLAMGGLMAINHGWGKFQQLLSGDMEFGDPLGIGSGATLVIAVLSEFVAGILIAMGLFTRWALIPFILTMAVAAFIVHGSHPFGKKELALIYLLGGAALYMMGPGRYSLDAKLGRI